MKSLTLFCLLHRGRAALFVPGISDGELGAHLVFRVRIGIQQRLQIQPGNIVLALFHGNHGAIE